MSTPKVSIVSVYYNREDHVTDSVQSVLDQTHDDFEFIIIDDGSTDSTLEQLKAIKDPRLKIIAQKDNTGFVQAIINAVTQAKGDYIAIHGSGDVSFPERIKKQAAILDNHNDVGIVGCHVEDDKKTGDGTYILRIPNDLPFTENLIRHNMFTHGEVMFRRSIYDKVGGYRPFFACAQDHDLWLRMSAYCDYRIIEKTLYRRFRLCGGISKKTDKEVLQADLSEFAVYCARTRRDQGYDPLERYGPQAISLRTPSERLAIRLIWVAMPHMLAGRYNDGWNIMERAIHEYRSLKVFCVYCVGLTHKQNLLWRCFGIPIYKKLYKSHLQRSRQI